jgi:hypothetical protein
MNTPDTKQTTSKSPSCDAACSPSAELRAMHKVLQLIRPLLVATEGDDSAPKWRSERAGVALCACDEALIAADMAHPEHDFYAENAIAQTPPDSGTKNHG